MSSRPGMSESAPPLQNLLARAGGIRGLVSTALPVAAFAPTSALFGLVPAIVAALTAAAVVLVWQLARGESTRPAVLGFAAVGLCAAVAWITGRSKDFYLPGIWMYLGLAVVFTLSVVIRRPAVGVVWAWFTGRDGSWRRVRRVRRIFDGATLMMAAVSWTRFLVQYHLYDSDREALLAVARIAMGWPVFVVTTTVIYLSIRAANRALTVSET
ncbi:UNVERIFIED_ORG: 4-amino-4-deoxy-L-arabinose transferase-like glycosyltransferase [Mycolicibacterium obuense]